MKKAAATILVFLCLSRCFLFPVSAKETVAPVPTVFEVNIDIVPSDYQELITAEQKKQYGVSVSTDQTGKEAAKINIRGNSSRKIGLASPMKRIPFELSFPGIVSLGGIKNKSVKFINSLYPYRLIAEYLALDLFAFAGIPTPEHAFAFIRFNDVDFGLYIAVEDTNKPFLSKWFPEPLFSAYKATDNREKESEYIDSVWFGHLFEKESGSPDHLRALFDALDSGKGYERYINVDEWLRYFACTAITGGDGSIFTEQNNVVLYDNNGEFELIPWDLSEAFSGRRMPDQIDRYYIWQNTNEPNPLFDLLMQNETYQEGYHAYIREFNEDFLSPTAIQMRYNAILDVIAPYLPRDHSILLNSENTLSELRSDSPDSFSNLRYMLNAYYLNLKAQLEGQADAFAVNGQFADYYDKSKKLMFDDNSKELMFEDFIANSSMLDLTLPDQIIRQGNSGNARLIGWGVCAAGVCACIILLILVKKKHE